MGITLATIVYNEAPRVRDMLESCLGVVDSLVAIDQSSDDDTVNIIRTWASEREVPSLVVTDPLLGYSEASRPRLVGLLPKFKSEWMLFLDADEALTPELKARLTDLSGLDLQGYTILRRNLTLNPDGTVFKDWVDNCQLRLLRLPCAVPSTTIHTTWLANPSGVIGELLLHQKTAKEQIGDYLRYERLFPGCTAPHVGSWDPAWITNEELV